MSKQKTWAQRLKEENAALRRDNESLKHQISIVGQLADERAEDISRLESELQRATKATSNAVKELEVAQSYAGRLSDYNTSLFDQVVDGQRSKDVWATAFWTLLFVDMLIAIAYYFG